MSFQGFLALYADRPKTWAFYLINNPLGFFFFAFCFVLFFLNIIAEHFLHDLKERESFYLGKKTITLGTQTTTLHLL